MRSLRSAAELLSCVDSIAGAASLLRELHFVHEPVLLETDDCRRFGISETVRAAQIVEGPGAIRALVAEPVDSFSIRDAVTRLARSLSSRTPHVFWLLIVVRPLTREVALAAWHLAGSGPRVAALIVNTGAIVDSDAETILSLADICTSSDLLIHSRYCDTLGRNSVTRRFYASLRRCVGIIGDSLGLAGHPDDAAELALLNVSRLLFLSFLETKGWLDGDYAFLANRYADCIIAGGRFHERVLLPLFFGTLNTSPSNRARRAKEFGRVPFLNGGLFTRSSVERRHRAVRCGDEELGALFGELLTRYRFTAREDTTSWSEAAIDPEMLGKAFESLMADRERKSSGAYYTPQSLVAQLTGSALSHALASTDVPKEVVARALAGEIPEPASRESLLRSIDNFRVIDPACGSGAFLVHALEELAALRVRLGDLRPLHVIRRVVLCASIFGVDRNRVAVWLCELRLWLSVAIEDPERNPLRVMPLPNIDRNIRVGDSLSGGGFSEVATAGRRLQALRDRYARAVGRRKMTLAKALDAAERRTAIDALDRQIVRITDQRRELVVAIRTRDLFGERGYVANADRAVLADLRRRLTEARRVRRSVIDGGGLPFRFAIHFADISSRGGFDLALGNPPWVRVHNIDPADRSTYGDSFDVVRRGGWHYGADAASANGAFGRQIDLAALFIETSVRVVRPYGIVALIVPGKLWRSLAGGGLREFLLENTNVAELHDLTDAPDLFDAAVYPSMIVSARDLQPTRTLTVVHRAERAIHWEADSSRLTFDSTRGSPWLLLPPEVRAAFDCVRSKGIPLSRTATGRPWLGVKTGCNSAFVVEAGSTSEDLTEVRSGAQTSVVESRMLRPLYRGESIRPWRLEPASQRIIWTHDQHDRPVRELPRHTQRWLASYRRHLERRADARNSSCWWRIFRTESAGTRCTRVVWPDFGRAPIAAVVDAGSDAVFLNSCYVAMCRDRNDAVALMALLNSPIAAAWLNAIAEPARGGYRRYLGWTVSLLPIPTDWPRAKRILVPLGVRAYGGEVPSAEELRRASIDAYSLTNCQVDPLILWNGR